MATRPTRTTARTTDRRILVGGAGGAAAQALLAGRGWTATMAADATALVARAAAYDFALCWLCGDPAADRALAARIARIPPPRGALPVLLTAADDPPPADAVLLARIAAAPPPGAASSGPLARLVPLLGAATATDLLTRFRDRLAALIAAPDPCAIGEGATVAALAHRMAGMAGMLDFPILAAAWEQVEAEAEAATPATLAEAWAETRIARATLDLRLDPAR